MEYNDLLFITRIIMVWILRNFLIMHQVFIQNNRIIFGEYELKRVWLKTINLRLLWGSPKLSFLCFSFSFFLRINTLAKNYIMKGAHAREIPWTSIKKPKWVFLNPFLLTTFIIIFMPWSLLLLSFIMSIVISLRTMKSLSWGVRT